MLRQQEVRWPAQCEHVTAQHAQVTAQHAVTHLEHTMLYTPAMLSS